MSMICNRCEMLTEPMGHNCEFCGKCVGGDECPKHKDEPAKDEPAENDLLKALEKDDESIRQAHRLRSATR